MLARNLSLAMITLALSMAAGCSRSLIVERPQEKRLDDAYAQMFTQEAAHTVQDGDIVLRRGYAVLSDVITLATSGPDVSHAGIYDATTGTVIEAVDGGVTERALTDYVRGSHRVVIVRTSLPTAERRAAVLRARGTIGTGFDYSGFVGLDDPDRFYCSELVAWAYHADRLGLDTSGLVAPGDLVQIGETVYDSGERGGRPLVAVSTYWR